MNFADLYQKYGSDLRKCEEYKGVCRELSLLSPSSLMPLLKDYLSYSRINIFDFINNDIYNNLIHEDLESNKKVDMVRKLFMTYYLYLREMEKIKRLTWK